MDEFTLIQQFFTRPPKNPGCLLGVGDDAALIGGPAGQYAIAADMLVAGRHFFEDAKPYDLGWKSLAVNLSDMAAMGATPRFVTLSLALPTADPVWLAEFAAGFWAQAEKHGVDLIGGDTTRGPLTISIQAIGELSLPALTRAGAQVDDDIWVSGQIGSAAAALQHLQGSHRLMGDTLNQCLERLHRPEPRIALGCALKGIAHSAIDISDGLLADLGHILDQSQVGARIDCRKIPVLPALADWLADESLRQVLLAGGDDYELCFTAPRAARDTLNALSVALNLPLSVIGQITPTPTLELCDEHRSLPIRRRGYNHFHDHP